MTLMYKGWWVHIPDELFNLPAKWKLLIELLLPGARALLV